MNNAPSGPPAPAAPHVIEGLPSTEEVGPWACAVSARLLFAAAAAPRAPLRLPASITDPLQKRRNRLLLEAIRFREVAGDPRRLRRSDVPRLMNHLLTRQTVELVDRFEAAVERTMASAAWHGAESRFRRDVAEDRGAARMRAQEAARRLVEQHASVFGHEELVLEWVLTTDTLDLPAHAHNRALVANCLAGVLGPYLERPSERGIFACRVARDEACLIGLDPWHLIALAATGCAHGQLPLIARDPLALLRALSPPRRSRRRNPAPVAPGAGR